MRSFPLFVRQMLFLALLYNAFHIIVSFLPNTRNSTCLNTVHQNHYQGNFFLLTLTTFQIPNAETSKLSAANRAHYAKAGFFFIHPTYSFDRNKAFHFFQNLPLGVGK